MTRREKPRKCEDCDRYKAGVGYFLQRTFSAYSADEWRHYLHCLRDFHNENVAVDCAAKVTHD